jgi:hypothetical protein
MASILWWKRVIAVLARLEKARVNVTVKRER